MKGWITASLLSSVLAAAGVYATLAPMREALAEQEGTFKGNWTANGGRRSLDFLPDRSVFSFDLQGHVNLKDEVGGVSDYWSDCVGLWDSVTGGGMRCVWRGREGTKIFSVLSGKLLEQGIAVKGEILGGTGAAQGIEGSFTFTWSFVVFDDNRRLLTGYTSDLAGSYRIP